MDYRLAAILAADVVGYAGRMAENEAGTIALLDAVRREVIDLQVGAHRGRVFKSMGDGILAEFTSTMEAVNCAIGIQRAMSRRGRDAEDTEPLRLRVGVSIGDVVVRDGDLLGNGVNIAARLEAMAEDGGIAISGEVMSQIRGKIYLQFEDCGYQKVKASDEPIHVFMTRAKGGTAKGLFDFDDGDSPGDLIEGGCLCGAVRFQVASPPISTGYCHCRCCQRFTGSMVNAWTAFPAFALQFTKAEPRYFNSSPIVERGYCVDCGSSLTYQLVKPRKAAYVVLCTASLDEPQNFAPKAHSGLESAAPWLEILDDLPRSTSADSRVLQEAWSSVGLPDPETWGPGAKAADMF